MRQQRGGKVAYYLSEEKGGVKGREGGKEWTGGTKEQEEVKEDCLPSFTP